MKTLYTDTEGVVKALRQAKEPGDHAIVSEHMPHQDDYRVVKAHLNVIRRWPEKSPRIQSENMKHQEEIVEGRPDIHLFCLKAHPIRNTKLLEDTRGR